MPTTLEIRDAPNGLLIHVTEPRRIGPILFNIIIGSGVIFIFSRTHTTQLVRFFLIGLGLFAIAHQVIAALRGANVELTVTNLDLVSTGHAPDGYKPSSIPRADTYNLEFQDSRGGDDQQPSGLYIEHSGILLNSTTCVLPHLDRPQTEQVIEAILHRFPDTTFLAPIQPGNAGLISLNLSQPNP